ncbi:MFS transporter [Halanaerobium salsuginis]|jgi:UMF1 family MFS transporter|uniref:MFS transporter, UMF1 family n=1 Tax=Halanaerobium salsuginis TaxID=29563 RepID=A0A1I4G2M8_9FIRM|nr:MFS transporter [Halanaerobium salsuginis]SFL23271.1 MFS transporter, UMF1 family [Halanaerobium salsuginis]
MQAEKKTIYAWAAYDWANSAFATVILATVLPIFYRDVAGVNLPGNLATSYWGYTQTIAMLIIALLSPLLGAAADYSGAKKKFLKTFVILGVTGTALLFFVGSGNYLIASCFFILANLGFAGGNIFYDSFLPEISKSVSIDHVSSLGYAAGYLGGGLLLAVNLILISKPALFKISSSIRASQISFLTVAIWWLLFSLPAFKYLPEPEQDLSDLSVVKYWQIALKRLQFTWTNLHQYQELWKFLLAFWLYNDGIGTIIRMATIYGREIGIAQSDLIGALLLTQFIAFPCALLFAKIAAKITAKRGIYLALIIYIIVTLYGYFLDSAFDFWLLAAVVGLVQGGAQALSRSLYGSMIPADKSAEFFGFFGVSSKFASLLGPTVFAYTAQLTGDSRYGILSITIFFVLGIILLSRVNVEKAREEY